MSDFKPRFIKFYEATEAKTSMEQLAVLNCLVVYYETAMQTGKLRSQRDYCRAGIYQCNPHFAKGYFKKEKP